VLDEQTFDFTLLLDDLAPARPGDQLTGLGLDQASAVLREAARLHAAFWADPALDEQAWLPRSGRHAEATGQLLSALWPGFLAAYADVLPPGGAELGARFVRSMPAWSARDTAPPCLVHGDFRTDNMMFGPAGVTVVDWQTVQHSAAAADVAYFLGGSLTVPDRRAHEEELLTAYHGELAANGVDRPLDQLREDYRRCALHGVAMTVGASMLVETDARGRRMFAMMAERHFTHALDAQAGDLLD
jgi:hypothetical protein